MTWDFDRALGDDLITVETRYDDMGTFEIRLGELETIISIELGRFMTSDKTKFIVSHAIKTPVQFDAYRTSTTFADDPGHALARAISGLTSYYRDAVKQGHKPVEAWLEPW